MSSKIPVIVIFDIGKTNKKILLFDERYKVVLEENKQFDEMKDDDGFPCEDVEALTRWIKESLQRLLLRAQLDIRAVNFSAYGASFVYLDCFLRVAAPLYSYLKPYPAEAKKRFYADYGGEDVVARETASPVLGNLNSGMQLYRLKYEKPGLFERIKWALHLPQYLSFILSSEVNSDITSLGSHTKLWDFSNNRYHKWVIKENVERKLPSLLGCTKVAGFTEGNILVGGGLHDSSAALIPYLISFAKPFILLSTGTWCITLNPFNQAELTKDELDQDCLCYLSYEGKPVKASRLFAGFEHEQQTRRLSSFFNKPNNYFESVTCDTDLLRRILPGKMSTESVGARSPLGKIAFGERRLNDFRNYEEAYHQLMVDLMVQQIKSTRLVLKGTEIKSIFVDGGFSQNSIYMYLLAEAFPSMEVSAASIPQASALGAALAIHSHWNTKNVPANIIDLELYSVPQSAAV